jgi:hypothetical protein
MHKNKSDELFIQFKDDDVPLPTPPPLHPTNITHAHQTGQPSSHSPTKDELTVLDHNGSSLSLVSGKGKIGRDNSTNYSESPRPFDIQELTNEDVGSIWTKLRECSFGDGKLDSDDAYEILCLISSLVRADVTKTFDEVSDAFVSIIGHDVASSIDEDNLRHLVTEYSKLVNHEGEEAPNESPVKSGLRERENDEGQEAETAQAASNNVSGTQKAVNSNSKTLIVDTGSSTSLSTMPTTNASAAVGAGGSSQDVGKKTETQAQSHLDDLMLEVSD